MPDLEVEKLYESDSSDNEENHSKLVSSISQLDSTQRVKPAQRKEIASEVSEFNLGESLPSRRNVVSVKELAQVLGKRSQHGIISKKIERVTRKSKTLPKPLEKVTEERLKRSIGFENVKKQLRKWDAIVERNALKDQICFPLNDKRMQMQKSNEFLSQFKTATPLEEELAKVLHLENVKETETEDNEFPLTLQEMMEKRKEMAQLRAKLSYRQTKAIRQSKIKSKKYHRLLKREKIRQQLKEFEMLQKTDPEAALKKLAELDKTRAQERASLRHRNTGQWAKNLSVRAKYDVETRKVLADQLKMSRELTQKVSQLESSDEEEVVEEVQSEIAPQVQERSAKSFEENPWTLDVSREVDEFVSGYKKYWSEQQKEIEKKTNGEVGRSQENGAKVAIEEHFEVGEGREEVEEPQSEDVESRKSNSSENSSPGNKSIKSSKPETNTSKNRNPEKNSSKSSNPESKTNGKDSPKSKKNTRKEKKSWVSIHPVSGVWTVTPLAEEPKPKNKRKAEDIDTLFEELDDELMKNAEKKVSAIEKNLKRRKNKAKDKKKENRSFNATLKNPNIIERPDMDDGLLEGDENVEDLETRTEMRVPVPEATPTIDPQNFIQVKPKRLRTHLPENITGGEDAIDDEKEQQMIIEEAFGGDDVMEEFRERKAEEERNSQIEIEKSLPGWGHWGGSGIAKNRRKKRLVVLNLPPRKDKHKKDVIINENENPNLRNHLVKEVPHPFNSVDAFEANIRAPVGREWVPETAHQKLIQKQVVTKLGTVIEPMSEEEIVRLNKAPKSPYKGKKKSKT